MGQHFLNSKHVLDQIISAARIGKGETVLEIGPGTGVLTEALLAAGAHVVAVEKDDRAISLLTERFSKESAEGQLTLIHGDILEDKMINGQISMINNGYALVANIPYYITGAILEKFLSHEPRPNRMVLLVQKEVAERIVARYGKESILSISVKAFGDPKIIARVPPGAFTPPPTVDSAILSIEDIGPRIFSARNDVAAQNKDIRVFFSLVKAGFSHKRKYLARNLEAVLSKTAIAAAWTELGLASNARAEDISLQTWSDLHSRTKNMAICE